MTSLLFIDDGYTCDACISEVEGIHGTLIFSYRPMTHEEREHTSRELRKELANKTPTDIMAETIASHVTAWNADIEINVKNAKRLVPKLFDRIYAVVAGLLPSDPLPDTGEKPEEFKEGADLKNL